MIGQLGLVGCGLIGGSFALALKRAGAVQRVVGYSATARTRGSVSIRRRRAASSGAVPSSGSRS